MDKKRIVYYLALCILGIVLSLSIAIASFGVYMNRGIKYTLFYGVSAVAFSILLAIQIFVNSRYKDLNGKDRAIAFAVFLLGVLIGIVTYYLLQRFKLKPDWGGRQKTILLMLFAMVTPLLGYWLITSTILLINFIKPKPIRGELIEIMREDGSSELKLATMQELLEESNGGDEGDNQNESL